MRNKFKSSIFIFIILYLTCKSANTNEPFVFDVTEVEILENGNQMRFYDGTGNNEFNAEELRKILENE